MLETPASSPSATPLPHWHLVGRSVADFLNNLRSLANLAVPWIALDWLVYQFMAWMFGLDDAYGITTQVVNVIAVSVISVPWHRQILLGEPLPRVAPIDRRVIRYGVFYGVFVLVWFMASTVLTLPIAFGGMISVLVGAVAIIAIAARLGVLFPGLAIDLEGMSFAHAWKMTEGATWRLFIGHITLVAIVLAPVLIILAILPISLRDMAGKTSLDFSTSLFDLGWTIIHYSIVLLLTAFVSHAYRHLAQHQRSGEQEEVHAD